MAKLLSGRKKHSTLANTFVSLENTEPFVGLPDSANALVLSDTDGTKSFFNFDNSFTIDSATGTISVSSGGAPGADHDSDLVQQQIDSTLLNSTDLGGQAHDSGRTQAQIDSSIGDLTLHDSNLVQRQIDSSVTTSSIGLLTDVNLTGLAHNKILKYDSNNQEFVVAEDTAESSGGGGDSGLTLAALSVVDQGGFGFLEYSTVSGIFTFKGTDSADVTTLIDSSYIQLRVNQAYIDTLDTHDSALVQGQIDSSINFQVDSAYFLNIMTPNLIDQLNLLDSSSVDRMIDSRVDSGFIRPLARAAIVAGTNVTYDSASGTISVASVSPVGVDSVATSNLIDSAYVRPLARAAIVAGTNITYDSASGTINALQLSGIDSTATQNFIDSAYVQSRANQFYIDTLDTHDSALVSEQITQEVNQSFVTPLARNSLVAGQFIIYDSSTGVIAATTAVDSALTLALIDSDYVQGKIKQSFIDTLDTHDSAAIQTQIDSTINALTLHDSARTQAQIDSNFNDAAVFLRSDQDDIAEGNIRFNNSVELRFGEAAPNQDFKIFHNSTSHKNFIQTTGTDSINIAANSIVFQDHDSSNTIFQVRDAGATDLYHSRTKVAETTANGMSMNQLQLDSSLNVDGIASFDSATVNSNRVLTVADLGAGNALDADTLDGVQGASFIRSDADDIVTANTNWNNDAEIRVGDGGSTGYDFRIYHSISANTNYIQAGDQDNLTIAAETVTIADKALSNTLVVNASGSTDLYYNKIKVAETTANGMTMNQIVVDSSLTVGGNRVLTIADEGSGNNLDADTLDSVEASQFLRSDVADIKTAGQLVMNDGIAIKFGTDSDHTITEAGGNFDLTAATGAILHLNTEDLQVKNQASNETMIRAQQNGAVDLYYDNGSKIQTTSTGVNIDTKLTTDSANVTTELQVRQLRLSTGQQNVGASITTVDEFNHSNVPMSVDYTVHSKDLNGTVTKGETSISKVFVTFDSAGAIGFTEFGTVFSGDSDFGDFSADVNSGKIRLRFTRRSGRDGAVQVKPFKTIIT